MSSRNTNSWHNIRIMLHHTFLQGNVWSCKTSAKHVIIFFSSFIVLRLGLVLVKKIFLLLSLFLLGCFLPSITENPFRMWRLYSYFVQKMKMKENVFLLISRIVPGLVKFNTCIYKRKLLFFRIRFIGDIFNILF